MLKNDSPSRIDEILSMLLNSYSNSLEKYVAQIITQFAFGIWNENYVAEQQCSLPPQAESPEEKTLNTHTDEGCI